jgi:hypothetical protein
MHQADYQSSAQMEVMEEPTSNIIIELVNLGAKTPRRK